MRKILQRRKRDFRQAEWEISCNSKFWKLTSGKAHWKRNKGVVSVILKGLEKDTRSVMLAEIVRTTGVKNDH